LRHALHVGQHASSQAHDGITAERPGAMVGDLAAAGGLMDLDPAGGQLGSGKQEMLRPGPAAQRDHRIVLAQEQGLGAPAPQDLFAQPLLQEGRPIERLPSQPGPACRRGGQPGPPAAVATEPTV
jgi:hypothetical protein